MRIERWLTVLALASTGSASAAGPGFEVASVDSQRGVIDVRIIRRTEMHPREDLRGVCRADREVDGCTDFPVETLQCECEQRGGAWMINPSAELHAVTHLRNAARHARLLAHEELHIIDLTRGLREHLDTLASRKFDSRSKCRAHAKLLSTSSHLRVVMNRLRVESNAKFGCSRGRF